MMGSSHAYSGPVTRNPLFEPNTKLDFRDPVPFQVRSANTLIRIESQLPGLLGSLGSLGIQADCRLYKVVTSEVRGVLAQLTENLSNAPAIPKAQRLYPDALELYFDTPAPWSTPTETRRFTWAIRAQITLSTQSETRYFPAPAVKDPVRFGHAYARADFTKTNRPFWADEETHKAP